MGWDKEKSLLIREMIGSYCISTFNFRELKFLAAKKHHQSMGSKVCVEEKFKANL